MFSRYTYALVALLLMVWGLESCEKIAPDQCRVVVHWEGMMDSIAPTLLLEHPDTMGMLIFDTIKLDKEAGKYLLDLYADSLISKASLFTEDRSWSCELLLNRGTQVDLYMDFQSPHLFRVEGYPEVDLRSDFIRSERKLIRRYDKALREGDARASDSLWLLVRTCAADYIVEHKDKPHAEVLMYEFFPGQEGMQLFQHLYPQEDLPESFRLYHMVADHWRETQRKDFTPILRQLPMPDSIRQMLPNVSDSTHRYTIIEFLEDEPSSTLEKAVAKFLGKYRYSDRFLFISYRLTPREQTQKFPHPRYYRIYAPRGAVFSAMDHIGIGQLPAYVVINKRPEVVLRSEDFFSIATLLSHLP